MENFLLLKMIFLLLICGVSLFLQKMMLLSTFLQKMLFFLVLICTRGLLSSEMGSSNIKRRREKLLEEATESVPEPGSGRVMHLVNFIGTVSLKTRKTEIVLCDESASEVRFEFEEFRIEVTALFLGDHAKNVTLLRKLLEDGFGSGVICVEWIPMQMLGCYLGLPSHLYIPMLTVMHLLLPLSVGRSLLSNCCYSVSMNIKVRLGAWAWDMATGEEFKVGAGLAEPSCVTWCAVEYFEASGSILRTLLQHLSPNLSHLGRTVIHHAILCNNARAMDVLLTCGADIEFPVQTTEKTEFWAIHLVARLGSAKVLQHLIIGGCNLNSKTESGETALMISTRYMHEDCLKFLASAGADFGLLISVGANVNQKVFWGYETTAAVRESHIEILEILVNCGATQPACEEALLEASYVGQDSVHALVTASCRGFVDVVDTLIKVGQCALSIAGFTQWTHVFEQAVLELIRGGKFTYSSNASSFSSLLFVTQANDIKALKKPVEKSEIDLDEQDGNGFSAAMIAAASGHVEAFRLLVYAGANLNLHNKHGETVITLSESNKNSEVFEKSVRVLTRTGYDVNVVDVDGYTPLMLAAKGGHGNVCDLLILNGAKCDIENARLETALALARKNGVGNEAERVILDELARKLVLDGVFVKKHTKEGKGCPHSKVLKMVRVSGFLSWGKSSKRNVICKGAEVGPSSTFWWNRRKKFDGGEPGVFRVVTTKNKEVHFVCDGGIEMAKLWVRGIELVTREAIFEQIEIDSKFLETQHIMDYSLLLGVHYRAPQHLRSLMSYNRSLRADGLGIVAEEGDEISNYPQGLVLVPRGGGDNSSVIGPHIKGSQLRVASATGDKEVDVDLLLPGTARYDH
ncbi:unnamed protein product [Camellia sinensis]